MEYCLTDLCELIMGQSPDSSSCNKDGKGIPFYQGNADFGDKNPTPRNWCLQPKKIAKKDDILISVRAPIGDLNIANEECCIGRGVAAIRMKSKECNRYYLYLFLESKSKYLQDCGTGSTFTAINKGVLETLKVNCPELKNQISIANEIENIKTAIKYKNSELLCLNEAVQSEFVEMFGENPVESGKWKVEKLEDISTVQTGGTPSRNHPEYFEGNIPWVTTANLGKNELTYEDAMEYISQDAINNSATKIIPANSLFIGIRVGVGKCSINRVDMCSNQDICGLSGFDTTIINLVFLKKVLDSYSDFFENAKRGTTIKGIKSDTIKKLKIFIPELNIQNQFASFIQQIDKSKFVVKQQIADFQQLLDNKMQ